LGNCQKGGERQERELLADVEFRRPAEGVGKRKK